MIGSGWGQRGELCRFAWGMSFGVFVLVSGWERLVREGLEHLAFVLVVLSFLFWVLTVMTLGYPVYSCCER